MRRFLTLAAASILVLAIPTCALASAATVPSATFHFLKESVSTNAQPQLTYQTQNLPGGSKIALQFLKFGPGQSWTFVEFLPHSGGTATAPTLPSGLYRFRLHVLAGQAFVANSASHYLNVTPATGGSGCGVCTILGPIGGAIVGWILDLF